HASQFLAFEELHRHVSDAVAAADVVDGDNIAVGQAARRFCLLVKARLVFGKLLLRQREIDGFDCDDSIQHRIAGLVDRAHGALPKLGHDLVAPQSVDRCRRDHGCLVCFALTLLNICPQIGWPASAALSSNVGSSSSAMANSSRQVSCWLDTQAMKARYLCAFTRSGRLRPSSNANCRRRFATR